MENINRPNPPPLVALKKILHDLHPVFYFAVVVIASAAMFYHDYVNMRDKLVAVNSRLAALENQKFYTRKEIDDKLKKLEAENQKLINSMSQADRINLMRRVLVVLQSVGAEITTPDMEAAQ